MRKGASPPTGFIKMNTKLMPSNSITKIISKLQDPHLVSAFQNYFGVYPIENIKNGNSKDKNGKSNRRLLNGVEKRFSDNSENSKAGGDSRSRVDSKFWYYIFRFGTSLGYELFYASFFPFWVWNLSSAVCRRVINIWVCVMYIGQVLKDIICWPRPTSPPVVHLEPEYVIEYGMPSTHAMVSIALPFSYWYFSYQRYDYPFILGLTVCSIWCVLVCCSRLYMGMHTVLDIIAGLTLAPVLMGVILPFSDALDRFQQRNAYSPLLTLLVMICLQMLYPRPNRWSPARADTSVILGTGTGFAFGSWLNYHLGFDQVPRETTLQLLHWPSCYLLGLWVIRMVVGLSCIYVFRTVLKNLTCTFLCFSMGFDPKSIQSRRHPCVEIPSKYITYIGIGLVITFIAPTLFTFLHIQRESLYEEV